MKFFYILFSCCLLGLTPVQAQKVVETLSGTVTDKESGDALIGVRVYFPQLRKTAVTDIQGNYHFQKLPPIKTEIEVSYPGHKTQTEMIDLRTTHIQNFSLEEHDASLSEVVVTGITGRTRLDKATTPMTYVSPEQLRETSSTNIIDALAHQPGLSQITTGSGISKPVIRGLGYNRLVVVKDGIRQEGQQWGDEHGIEVDPNSVYSAEVIKGPASLIYGSDALAGVVILNNYPVLPEGKMQGKALGEYQSNQGLFNYSVDFAGNHKGFVWNARYSQKGAHAYKNKIDDYVYGSGFAEKALSGMFGLNKDWGYSHLTLSHYYLRPDIVEGERNEQGEFTKKVFENGKVEDAVATHHDMHTYGYTLPYQHVYHDKVVSENMFLLHNAALNFTLGWQHNRRKEFEDADAPKEPGLYLDLQTVNYDLRYTLAEALGWKWVAGVGGMWQKNANLGSEFLIPSYRLLDAGAFITTGRDFGALSVNAGLRYDHRHLAADSLMDDGEQRFEAFTRNFSGLTAGAGIAYQLQDNFVLRANVAHGFRAPSISELSANGVHEGTARYELGNIHLNSEHSWQIDMGAEYSSHIVSAQLNLFTNFIQNYIFAQRLTDVNGQPLIKDDNETYQYRSGKARLMGGEVSVDFHPIDRLHIQNAFSYVSSVQLHQSRESRYLPFTPAPRWNFEVQYDFIRDGKVFNNTYLNFNGEANFKQNHVYELGGTETPTPFYAVFNLAAGTDFKIKGKPFARLVVSVENLFDRAYQNHLSRLKYAGENPLTGRRGVFAPGRSFNIKLVIPFNL